MWMRVCVSLCVCPMVSFMSLIRLALFTGLFYNTDISHTMVAVCVNVILLSICPSSNLKTRAYEKEISEVLWTKIIEQLKGKRGKHKPEETQGPSHPSEDTDLIKMAAEWWHDGQHWLKALGCMTRNPGCVCTFVWESCFYLVHLPPQSIPYIVNITQALWSKNTKHLDRFCRWKPPHIQQKQIEMA